MSPAKPPVSPSKAPAAPTGGTGAARTPGGWDFVLRWAVEPGGLECRTIECRCGWQHQPADPTEIAAIDAWQRHLNDRTH